MVAQQAGVSGSRHAARLPAMRSWQARGPTTPCTQLDGQHRRSTAEHSRGSAAWPRQSLAPHASSLAGWECTGRTGAGSQAILPACSETAAGQHMQAACLGGRAREEEGQDHAQGDKNDNEGARLGHSPPVMRTGVTCVGRCTRCLLSRSAITVWQLMTHAGVSGASPHAPQLQCRQQQPAEQG